MGSQRDSLVAYLAVTLPHQRQRPFVDIRRESRTIGWIHQNIVRCQLDRGSRRFFAVTGRHEDNVAKQFRGNMWPYLAGKIFHAQNFWWCRLFLKPKLRRLLKFVLECRKSNGSAQLDFRECETPNRIVEKVLQNFISWSYFWASRGNDFRWLKSVKLNWTREPGRKTQENAKLSSSN